MRGGSALRGRADGRRRRDKRRCNNQPDKRHERGVLRGGSAMRGGGQADGRRQGDERWHNNQPGKRRERGAMRGGGTMRGGGAGNGRRWWRDER